MHRSRRSLALAWLAIAALTTVLIVANTHEALRRYRALDSGWSWDLAYYNQWFWSLTRGDGQMSVRPLAPYGQEDLSIWWSNYLVPVRLAIAPIYAMRPEPETLLVVEAVLLWMVVPAAFVLALGESESVLVALAAACLVPLTPLLVPLAANDFRELQLAIPFVVLAVEGVRGAGGGWRRRGSSGCWRAGRNTPFLSRRLASFPRAGLRTSGAPPGGPGRPSWPARPGSSFSSSTWP